jgi:hypothetical protein
MPLHKLRFPSVLPLLLLVVACNVGGTTTTVDGSGSAATETREVSGFRSVSFALPGTLHFEHAEEPTLRIEADDNLLPHVVTRVRDGDLRIGPEENTRLQPRSPLRVYVSAPAIEAIRTAGSGSVEAPNLRATTFSLTIAGTGDAHLSNLQADVLEVQLAGSGNVEMSGRTRRQVLQLAGSGGVDALELESDSLDANVIGSGSAVVRVRDWISANLVGSGSVSYAGDPEVTSRSVGSGRVNRLDP